MHSSTTAEGKKKGGREDAPSLLYVAVLLCCDGEVVQQDALQKFLHDSRCKVSKPLAPVPPVRRSRALSCLSVVCMYTALTRGTRKMPTSAEVFC